MVIQEHFSDTLDTLGQEHLIWRSYDKMSLMNFLYGVNHLLDKTLVRPHVRQRDGSVQLLVRYP